MTVKRLLALLLVWVACSIPLKDSAAAQSSVRVQLRNASQAPLTITVYDEVCRQRVFNGTLNSRAQRPITLCPDRHSRGQIIVYDRFGEQRRYRIRRGQVLSLRASYGSGGLGR